MPGREPEDFAASIERAQRVMVGDAGMFGPDSPGQFGFEGNPRKLGKDFNVEVNVQVFTLPSDRGEYEEILNQVARGEALIRYEERAFDKEGNFRVAICYMTPRPQAAAPPDQAVADAEAPVLPRRLQ